MANCPVCKTATITPSHLEDSLPVLTCSSCGGSWLRANEYLLWLRSQEPGGFDESRAVKAGTYLPVTESNKAAICPDCDRFLRSYRVGTKIDFHLDRCNHCNGVWLDKNEWEALKAADLHDEINRIFTKPWQQHITDEISARKLDALYLKKMGAQDYERIKEIREWLQNHPNRTILMAFLLDKDPYSP